jgi:hypothetical protein
MKIYAYVQGDGVAEIIAPATYPHPDPADIETYGQEAYDAQAARAGQEIPITERYTPEFCAACVNVTDVNPQPQVGWIYSGATFAPYVPPAPTPAQLRAVNSSIRDGLMAVANAATVGMADAYVAGLLDASDTAMFKAWAAYKFALSKVDLTAASPAWPSSPSLSSAT